jgi:hypothetical protein
VWRSLPAVLAASWASICHAAAPTTYVECVIVTHAQIKQAKPLTGELGPIALLQLAHDGHEIESGQSTVIGLRVFEDDNAGVDSASFVKVTAEFPSSGGGSLAAGIVQIARSYYTSGGVGFLSRGEYYIARDLHPTVRLTQDGGKLTLNLDTDIEATYARDGGKKRKTIHYSCPLKNVAVKDLNEWQGRPSTGWRAFAPPHLN